MKNILEYKGFIGSVHYSAEDNVFYGKVEGVNDLVTFEGESVNELKESFHSMVDEHINDCLAENIVPEKSYKGSFNVRIDPDLHRRISLTAKMHGISLNKFIAETLSQSLAH